MGLWYDKRYKTYRYLWRDPTGRQHTKRLSKDKKVAVVLARDLDRARDLGDLAPLMVRYTISGHLEWFIQYHMSKKRPKTVQSYAYALKKLLAFLEPEAILYLDQLTRPIWEKFEHHILNIERLSVETRNDIYTTLSVFLNLAVANHRLSKNPLIGVRRRLKNPNRRLPVIFTDSQIAAIRRAAPSHFVVYIDLLLLTGLRVGEIWSLEWTDIDFKKTILIVQAKPDLGHIPKDYELRQIDLGAQALEVLSRLPRRGRFVLDNGRNKPALAANTMMHIFARTLKEARIAEGSLHCLRRTFASRLEAGGASLRYIQGQLGHESILTTQKYLHPMGEVGKERGVNLSYTALNEIPQMAAKAKKSRLRNA